MDDGFHIRTGLIDFQMKARFGRRLAFSFYDMPLHVDEQQVGRPEFSLWHTGRRDDNQAVVAAITDITIAGYDQPAFLHLPADAA